MVTLALLLGLFAAGPELFRTGWFVESLSAQLLIILVNQTRRLAWASGRGWLLLGSATVLLVLTLAIPCLPGAELMGFVALPALLGTLIAITILYVAVSEAAKHGFARLLQ